VKAGSVIESGQLPDGTPYRVWRPTLRGSKVRVYVGAGDGVFRNVKWLREVQRGERVLVNAKTHRWDRT
jgi:hypothetical protein